MSHKQNNTIWVARNNLMHDYFWVFSTFRPQSDIYLMDRGHFLETNNVYIQSLQKW